MIIQNYSKPIQDFFKEAGFLIDEHSGRILSSTELYVGRADISDWVELRITYGAWSLHEKVIKDIVGKYEKFSGLQVFIKIQ